MTAELTLPSPIPIYFTTQELLQAGFGLCQANSYAAWLVGCRQSSPVRQ